MAIHPSSTTVNQCVQNYRRRMDIEAAKGFCIARKSYHLNTNSNLMFFYIKQESLFSFLASFSS
ncbi:hypothetical protein KP509_39G005100 [Ceratopteris richardii]|uniref:Uncharacterized protein n=1 Tax=Ceratopteris richardii TaxID=49495 RepID=A0A8T2PY10_CERRI|nr:hypothetical protein KP509_39G005100 [Ceratopteris richardii]